MKNHFTQKLFASAVMLSAVAFAASADIKIGERSYTNLNAAVGAVQNGETILISGSVDCTWTFNPGANLNFKIEGVGEDATINIKRRAKDNTFRLFFNLQNENVGLTLKNLTISMVEVEGVTGADFDGNLIQQQSGTLTMENVIVKGFATKATNGAIRIYGKAVSSGLKNVAFEDCTIPNNYNVFCAKGGYSVNIGGKCNYTVRLNEKTSSLTADNIAEGSNIDLSLASSMTGNDVVVKGTEDFEMFTVAANGTQYILGPQDGNIVALADNNVLLVQIVEGKTTSSTMANFPKATDFTTGDNIRILLYKDVNFTSSVSFAGKTIEIAGAKDGVTLKRTTDRYVVNGTTKNTHVTVKNLTLSQSADCQYNFVILDKATSSVALHNVAFKNNNVNGALVAQSAGDLVLDGVTFDNCTSSAGALVTVGAPGNLTLTGLNNGLSIYPEFDINKLTPINCEGIQIPNETIKFKVSESFIESIPNDPNNSTQKLWPIVITNFNHRNPGAYFYVVNTGYALDCDNDGKDLVFLPNTLVGVEKVDTDATEDVAPVYYNLNGVKVSADALTPGLYICVKGDKASKVVIR